MLFYDNLYLNQKKKMQLYIGQAFISYNLRA